MCWIDDMYTFGRLSRKVKPKQLIEETRARYDLVGVAVDAIDAVADVRDRPLWPPADTANQVDLVEVAKDAVEPVEDDDGMITQKRIVKMKVCAPRPKVTSKTRHVVLHFHGKRVSDTSLVAGPSVMVFALTEGGKLDLSKHTGRARRSQSVQ